MIEIARIRSAYEKLGDRFLYKIYTPAEIAYCSALRDRAVRLAGHFAAKEATAKALGVGFGARLGWHDVAVIHDERGAPLLLLPPHFSDHFLFSLSISHCRGYAMACVLCWEREGQQLEHSSAKII